MRFDGLLLAATLAIAASIYLALALAAAMVWLSTGRRRLRAWGVAQKSGVADDFIQRLHTTCIDVSINFFQPWIELS